MIGIIPRIWVNNLRKIGTPPQVANILAALGHQADFEYALDQPYSDDECAALMKFSQDELQLSQDALFASFAHTFIQDGLERWPVWFEMSPTARDFLERQPRIHDRFSRGLNHNDMTQGGYTAKFDVTPIDQGLRVLYRSPNQLCRLYMALARALLAHYGDTAAQITEPCCMHQGHAFCDIHIVWPSGSEQTA